MSVKRDHATVYELRTILRATNFFEVERSYETLQQEQALERILDCLRVHPISLVDVEFAVQSILEIIDKEHEAYAARIFASTVLTLPTGTIRQATITELLSNDHFRSSLQKSTEADMNIMKNR